MSWSISDNIAAIAAGAAIASVGISITSLIMAARASIVNKNMFRRQSVVDLHMAWQNLRDINPKKPVTPDVVKAVSTLNLTASLWLHDVVDRNILCQSYYPEFKTLYESLEQCNVEVPETNKKGRDFLTHEVKRAYSQMSKQYPLIPFQTSL
ncbi:MAG: hypothetical protein GY797_08780 [Deltaproteobacteria bacterium]|nr:hypothetical protein [Deltaproteobacteria bacterium]